MDRMLKNIALEALWEAPDAHLAALDLDEALEGQKPRGGLELPVASCC